MKKLIMCMVLALSAFGCTRAVVAPATEDIVSDTVVAASDVTVTTAEDVTQTVEQ